MKPGTKYKNFYNSPRGPVIGPMVIVGFCIQEKELPKIKSLGLKDSKLLTPKKREDFYKELIKFNHYKIIHSPKEIDNALDSPYLNLNKLEAITIAKIINKLKPDMAFIDCPSNNIPAYETYLKNFLETETKLILKHKADQLYEVVSAASIIAKVVRDREIEKIKKKIKIDFGSGYPADPKTISFLKKYGKKYPNIFRKSWATYKNHISQRTLDLF